ncbi:hypothetical protein F5Y04DRAFT_248425 [Hypomontagnella monticulosa]|nr:hypothetical protein F5Y04DRAFT_248425 [Hypomontagnella monticulosa]
MDDSKDHLLRISVRHRKSIVDLLLTIQEEHEQRADVLPKFLNELECFRISPSESGRVFLWRRWIKVSTEKDYIALSYTWNPSEWEDDAKGRYFIQKRDRSRFPPSPVRNCILDRITKYMDCTGVKLLWIDRHSIPQQTSDERQRQRKAAALRSMDLVYKESRHPVALLGRPINLSRDLQLLQQVFTRKFAVGVSRRGGLQSTSGQMWMDDILKLLFEITSDLWWQRAWTFQENYKGGMNMKLLISHPDALETEKRDCGIFGNIPGEICVKSVELFEKATQFCLAFKDRKQIGPRREEMIEQILAKAGRYRELLDKSRPMDPAIITDTEKRDVKEPWDRLSIVANCCDYPVRLDERCLQRRGCSLSLSMLAMCLLNGLILYNETTRDKSASKMCVSEFLETQCFWRFYSPSEVLSLTFNKGCRFINVELTQAGVRTEGHLWKLGPVIDTARFGDLEEQQCLDQLCRELRSRFPPERELANCIEAYPREDVENNQYVFVEEHMSLMARTVAKAIEQKKKLRLGSLWEPRGRKHPCTAVFVWQDTDTETLPNKPRFVFTSSQPKEIGKGGYYVNDTDRHVSLEVRLKENRWNGGVPYLYTKRWILGLCFFAGCPRTKVTFPWPPALKDIKPDP